MLMFVSRLTFLLIVDRTGAGETALEVELDIAFLRKVESDDSLTSHRCLGISRNVECQVIRNITDVSFTLLGKLLGDAFFRYLRRNAQH